MKFGSIRSYRRYLKSRGLTDDISHKELRRAVTDDSKRLRHQQETIRTFTQQLEPAMRQRDARWMSQQPRRA